MAAPPRDPPSLIAVHVGAGWHAPAKEAAYKAAMCAAISAARSHLARPGATSLGAAVAAMRVLEDSPLTNAGYGSNLNLAGSVECDAAAMAGDGAYGALGAAPGVRHPAAAAAVLAEESREPLPLGLVRPMLLAGDAARRWAQSRGLEAAASEAEAAQALVSPSALDAWRRYSGMLQRAGGPHARHAALARERRGQGPLGQQPDGEAEAVRRGDVGREDERRLSGDGGSDSGSGSPPSSKRRRRDTPGASCQQGVTQHAPQPADTQAQGQQQEQRAGAEGAPARPGPRIGDVSDTVGCVVIGSCGAAAAAVSSGGVAMKVEGRVGEAAAYGCGCWAEDPRTGGGGGGGGGGAPGTAVSVSGLGEAIVRAGLARACADALRRGGGDGGGGGAAACAALLREHMLQGPEPIECGVLAARVARSDAPAAAAAVRAAAAAGAGGAGAPPGRAARVRVELAAAHTSPSFGIAYQAPGMAAPEAIVLRLPGGGGGGGAEPNEPQSRADGGCGADGDGSGSGGEEWSDARPRLEAGVAPFEFCCSWGLE